MILVVEDHADTRAALLRLLSIEGYDGVAAGCGRDALALLKYIRPRLVILDCALSDGGLAILRAIRSDRGLDRTRVIMFCANDCGSQRHEARAVGVDAYVLKGTLDWLQLAAEIRRLAGPPRRTHMNEAAAQLV
jgi:CheY-like chemotaxis protein